ncbi:phosphorelay sensor kinase [Aureococcus anophagefferens]|nr:phosphorelay sensor kinase [Aureococcus anophagefferens]
MQPNPSPRRRSRRTLPASAYPGASPPTAVRCAQQPAEADLTEATLTRNESHDNMETVDARRAANTRRFVGCLRRACLGCFAIYACCVVLFLATVTPAPDGWDAQATLRTFSQMTASCFGTAALLNLLAVAFEDESVLGDGSPSARARVAPFTCIFVINVVSCASHAAIALDLLPRHVMFDGRVFHSARWAEWCALVPLLMVLMHALNFDPNGDEEAPVRLLLWDPPAPVALACLLLSTAAYCHIFVVLGDVLAKAKAAYDEKRDDRKGDRPAKSFSRDVAAAGRRLRLARAALLTVVCAGTWTLFVVVYFSGLFRLVSPLYEGLLYNVVDVVAKCLYAGALGAAHSRALSPEHALRRLLQFEVEATTQRRRFLRYVMHEVRVPLNAVRLGVRAISDYVGYGRGQSPEGDRPSLEVVEVVEASISCMSETLDDVLSFASIEEGRFTLHRKPFAVRDLVDQAVATHAPSARERGVALIRAGELQQGRGSGLGLAISREIVQLHGGTIGVVSDVGRGSEFYFVIPLPVRRRAAALVVDDVSSNRKLIAFHVRKLGFEVELAEDGAEAVAAHSLKRARTGGGAAPQDAADDGFDLILMDSVMPVMNGLDATRAIRAAGCDALIVGVTGNALAEDIAAFVAAGANCVVTKPVSVAQLKDELAKYGLAD